MCFPTPDFVTNSPAEMVFAPFFVEFGGQNGHT
jgi:hypothetical protein